MSLFASADVFKGRFFGGLFEIIERADVTPSEVVLVLNNSLIHEHKKLFEQAARVARAMLGALSGAAGSDDHEMIRFILDQQDWRRIIQRRDLEGTHLICNPARQRSRKRRLVEDLPKPEERRLFREFRVDEFTYQRVAPREVFTVEGWGNHFVSFLYNKSPYDKYHVIVVLDMHRGLPQFLTEEQVYLMWDVHGQMQRIMPGAFTGWNAYLAYSSVGQGHFNVVGAGAGSAGVMSTGLPAMVLATPAAAMGPVKHLQNALPALCTFNLPMTEHGAYLVPRQFQGVEREPAWKAFQTGPAVWETARGVAITDPDSLGSITPADLDLMYRSIQPDSVPVGAGV